MIETYIESVHTSYNDMVRNRNNGPRYKVKMERLLELEANGNLTFVMGDLDEDPGLPKDTTIRVGGTVLEICVLTRVGNLRNMGYTDVSADGDISISSDDIEADCLYNMVHEDMITA